MADNEAQRAMSIIPYPTNREVVLRHDDSVVVYDPRSKQLVLRGVSEHRELELNECPLCHRPLRDEDNERSRDHHRSPTPDVAAGFVSPEYFRMLHHSSPGSTESTPPPSPRRRLVQPVRSGTASPAHGPRGVEFLSSAPAPPPSSHGISSAAFSPNYFNRFFVEERELGRGGKGVVLLVRHLLDGVSLGHFACKRVPVGDDHEWLKKVLIEVQLLQHLSHQNLVSYRHVWLEDVKLSNFGPSVPCAFILQQYCNAGDLRNYILSSAQSSSSTQQLKERIRRRSKNQPEPPQGLHSPRRLQFEEIYSFFRDITSGLNHLHINNYIHRDLKPSNCLLHDTGNGLRVLVSDFGEVQIENTVRKSTGATGTISYCAPEVLRRVEPSGAYGNFTTKSDIFSLGMILYFLCFAQLPYRNVDNLNEENEDIDQLRDEITSWSGLDGEKKMRPDLPEKLYQFLRRLLSLNPANRPSAEDILHGIKTGAGLEETLNATFATPGPVHEDLRASTRISSVDSPPSRSPGPTTPARKMSTSFSRPGVPSKLRLSFHDERSNTPSSGESGSERATSPGGTLVLRSRFPSPVELSEPPEPIAPSSYSTFQRYVSSIMVHRAVKVVLLLIKLFSVTMPCAPVAATPWVAYPLLGLATTDLYLDESGLWVSISLVAAHVVLLLGSSRAGVLCVPKASVWEGL
ncbi:MAG: IKS kinase [Lasallia pustulata]|uniref:non-specific serine/threonine protein kinase n=1 Tax=Lasallia pustulata TaxID=136370 RepID=A0A5M8PF16_9LECA|nr:MAG: IKS kinase [Lasallia pustulata]